MQFHIIIVDIQSQPAPDIKIIKTHINKEQQKEESPHSQDEDINKGEQEYILCLKNALSEALSENDFVSLIIYNK